MVLSLHEFGVTVPARFVARPNRFLLVAADARGTPLAVACQDPGRLTELLLPGVELRLQPAPTGSARRTGHTALMVRHRSQWVGLVPALANALAVTAIGAGRVTGFEGARITGREVGHGASRFDLRLAHEGRSSLAEVKSVSLLAGTGAGDGDIAYFPDAPTARGTRHVQELAAMAAAGRPAALIFVVQRSDASEVRVHPVIDPAFATAMAAARRAGVRIAAFRCHVDPERVTFVGNIPFR